MAEDNNKPTTRLGDIPSKIRIRTPEEIAAIRQRDSESQSLIGGKDSTWAGSFLGNVVEGAAGVVASPFKAIDRALAAATGAEYSEERASPIGKLGYGIEEAARFVGQGDPERAEDFSSKFGQGLGSTAGFLIPGAVLGAGARGAAGIGGLGAAATGVEQAEDYEGTVRAAGGTIDPTKQGQALFAGMLPGTIEAVPLVKMLGRMDDIVKGGLSAAVKNTAKGTVEEALQEGIQSTAQNLIASDLIKYDPERNMFFDTPEAAAVGGGVGFLMNSVMSALGLRQRGKFTEASIKALDSARKEAGAIEEEQAKVNPATGEAIENSDIAKTHKLIQRYNRLGETDPIESNRKAYQKRVEELQQELRTKYFTKDAESGEYTSSAADRQEATDVLTGIGVEEVEQIDSAPAPFEDNVDDKPVQEAEPFPKRMGKQYRVSEITNQKEIDKFNQEIAKLRPEEITITAPAETFPTAEGIGVEEVEPTIEEINLDTTPAPQERPFFDDRPANTALADQLQRITEQRKRRDETDTAFEARKAREIDEAYRQRELQLADETQAQDIQPATTQPTAAPATEQTQEAVRSPEAQTSVVPEGGIVTKSGAGFKSEAIAKAQMKRQGVDGTVTEYAPGQFAIVPNVEQIEDTLQTDIERAKAATRRQAGIETTPTEGPVDLRRQAGLPVDLDTLPPLETPTTTDELIPSLRDREGIPTPNGNEVVTKDTTTPVTIKPRDSHLDVADRLLEEVGRASDIGRYSEEDVSTEQRQIKKILDNPKLSDKQKFTTLQSSLSAVIRKNNSYRPTTPTVEEETVPPVEDEVVTADDLVFAPNDPELNDVAEDFATVKSKRDTSIDERRLDRAIQQGDQEAVREVFDRISEEAGMIEGQVFSAQMDRAKEARERPARNFLTQKIAEIEARIAIHGSKSMDETFREINQARIEAQEKFGMAPDVNAEEVDAIRQGIIDEYNLQKELDSLGPANDKPVFAHNNAEGWRRFNWYVNAWKEGGKVGLPQFSILSDYYPFSRGEKVPTEPEAYVEAWREKMVRDFGPEPKASEEAIAIPTKARTVWHGGTWDGESPYEAADGSTILFTTTNQRYAEQYAQEHDAEGALVKIELKPNKELNLVDDVFDNDQELTPRIKGILENIGVDVDRGRKVAFWKDKGAMTYLSNQKALIAYARKEGYQSIILPDSNPDLSVTTMTSVVVLDPSIITSAKSASTKKVNPETGTPSGVTPGTYGDLWTGTHQDHLNRIEGVQGEKYYWTISNMTEADVAEYRELSTTGRSDYIEKKHRERIQPLIDRMSKSTVANLRSFLKLAEVPNRSKLKTKAQILNYLEKYMTRDAESMATGYFSVDPESIGRTYNKQTVVDDNAGYTAAGSDTSEGTVEQVINSPVEKPEQIPLNGEVYDEVVRLADAMRASQNPQNFADEVAEKFGSVQQFLSMHSAIEAGYIVREGENATPVTITPVGTVETTESLKETSSSNKLSTNQAVEASLDEVESRLNAIDVEIADLQDELDSGYAESPSDIKKQIARLKKEQKQLESQQQNLHGEKQKISEDEVAEIKAIDNEVTVFEDNGIIEPSADLDPSKIVVKEEEVDDAGVATIPRPSNEAISLAKRVVDRFVSQMDPAFRKLTEFYVVADPSDIPNPEIRANYIKYWEGKGVNGLYYQGTGKYKDTILIMAKDGKTRNQVEWTVFHEVIGHFGFKKMFGNSWNTFLDIALKNPQLAAKAYALGRRWTKLGDQLFETKGLKDSDLMEVEETLYYVPNSTKNFKDQFIKRSGPKHKVNRAAMRALMDEYIAEIAGNMSNKTFRDASKEEISLMNRIRTWIRHLFRKAGIQSTEVVTEGDILSFVSESYTRILGTGPAAVEGVIEDVRKNKHETFVRQHGMFYPMDKFIDETSKSAAKLLKVHNEKRLKMQVADVNNPGTDRATVSPSADLLEARAAVEESLELSANLGHIVSKDEGRRILRSIIAREGRLDNSTHQRRVERVSDWVRRTKVGKVMSSNGHLPFVRVLNAVENWTKGGIEKGQLMARKYARKTKDLNDIQKKAIFDYFKTKNADVSGLPVSEEIKQLSKQNKDYIEKLGESLVVMGVLRRETWEADRGSYLTVRYFHYLEGYYATGGKRMSFQNYLKQQKGLSKEEKAALGEIKDPSFLVPETVATISRDVALNGMFKNIITMDEVGKLGWTLGERQFTEVDGKKMKLSDIEKKIESLTFLKDAQSDLGPLYKDEQDQQAIEAQLQLYMDARTAAKNALRDEVRQVLTERGETEITQDMINQVIDREYIQVNDKRYGALHKKYIRKELYDEIIDSSQFYDKEHADFFGKAFGAGGYADRANQRWKSLKVTLNPPSWFRNGMGNLILMDIGTNTSIGKLVGMTVDEVNSWIKGKPSKYFEIAHDNGLWATTYSAAELNLMSQQFQDAFKGHVTINTERNFMKKAWWMFDEKLSQIFEKGTEIYGGMEGFFKTVALRDYIQRWEKQSGTKLDDADANTRESVIREAVEAANNNIFDYSKVPGWMRTMRRMPFVGAPFLTYTFKAFPYVMESFARRPQKFIKYMALPYVMAQAFMANQDLDDDDYEEIMRMLPKWQKEKSSIYLLPWKDSNGNFQTIDFGYYLPWAPFQNLSLMAANTFDMQNPLLSTGNVALNLGTDLGFLGGPLPQMISAAITNKDPFSGREIVRTAGTTLDKQNDFMRYMVDMWTPTFLTSKGVLGRTLDNLGVEPSVFNTGQQLNALGKDKETFAQSSLRGLGISVRPVDPQLELRNKVKAYQYEKRKLETARRQIFKDRNLSPESRAAKVREMNEQIKLLNQKHREELYGE